MSNYQLKADLLVQKVDDEMVLLEPESGDYFTLNPVGADMVELFQQGLDIDLVAEKISDLYKVSATEAKQDFLDLLAQLENEQLAEKI
jgi:hypothetical protein